MRTAMKTFIPLFLCLFVFWSTASSAGKADVVEVRVEEDNKNSYSFSVAVMHGDTGWEHYADKWEVIDEAGNILGVRTLHHPHVNEKPFTRTLSGVEIPDHIKTVTIRAHDSVHKYGGEVLRVELP